MATCSPLSTALSSHTLSSFKDCLGGEDAFYLKEDYSEEVEREFSEIKPLSSTYVLNTESKIVAFVKLLLSIIIFPIGLYQWIHSLAGRVIIPASCPQTLNEINELRGLIPFSREGVWTYKRITIEVDGYKIDAVILGKPSTLENGRWVLASHGNGQFYEDTLLSPDFKEFLTKVEGNAIVFNYPGVGSSSGSPNRKALTKAYRAVLSFLEDEKKGIGAKEIIGYGHSMGGAVQAEALKTHQLKKDIKYVFVKSRTFSNLSSVASGLTCRFVGILVKIFGWNMDVTGSSKQLEAPEIILQTANVLSYKILKEGSTVIDDDLIAAKDSLAKALLKSKKPLKDKVIIGIPEMHNDPLEDLFFLAAKIESFLSPQTVSSAQARVDWFKAPLDSQRVLGYTA